MDIDTSLHSIFKKDTKNFLYTSPQMMAILRRGLGILLLIGCLILSTVPTALCRSPAPTIYVSGDGSGDFNCDGKDDHVQINQALKFVAENSEYTTVYLRGPFTYVIDDTLLIGSNTILEGDSTAVVKLVDNAGWTTMKPLIKQMNSAGNSNITIRGFEVNVNHDGNSELSRGKGYYNIIYLARCSNVKVYNMYMHDGHGDGLRIKFGENIQFYNNRISKLGHDGLFAIDCMNVEAWNNTITSRTNSGLRVWNSNKVKFHDNVIESSYYRCTGGPGIQVEKSTGVMDTIEIYNNTIYETYGQGIWIFNYDTDSATRDQGKNVYIHNNIFYNTGTNTGITWTGAILAGGFNNTTIENNVFDGAYHAAVVHMYMTGYSSDYSPNGKYTTIIRNNIITNTQKRIKDPSGTGYAIINNLPETHKFLLENNCLYNNSGGTYKNCTSKTDIYVDPLFVDKKNHDYHLKSVAGHWNGKTWIKDSVSSPCIDAGCPSSDYSKEPEDNGNKINIGRYGNTIYASKSERMKVTPILEFIPDSTVKIGENLNFVLRASDADGDSLTYSATYLPTGATLNSESGIFSWTPAANQKGNYKTTFKVSDGTFIDSQTANISVGENNSFMNLSGKIYDNRLREVSPENAFTDTSFLDVGGMSEVGRYRDIIWFNLSEYSSAEDIISSTISLYWYYPSSSRTNDTVIEIYRPASSWDPNYVSWNNKNKDTSWNKQGGDWYDKNGVLQGSTPYATLTLEANNLPNNTYCKLNVTDLVREYVSGKYPNTGFLIKARNENNNYIAFYSSKYGDSSRIPNLNVTKKVTPDRVVNVTLTDAKDNLIRESSPGTIFSNKVFLDIGGMSSSRYRNLIFFDFSKFTGATEVRNAIFSLYWYYPNNPRLNDTVIEVYRPASSWDPSYVSWNYKDKDTTWNKPGGDWYDKNGVLQGNTPYTTLTFKANSLANNSYCELNVTDLVKEYVSGKYPNTGFLIKARNENNNYIAFYSSDCGSVNLLPQLDLSYR